MTVALSWGHALQSMVYATTSDQEHHRLTLVQLVGGLSSIRNEISGQELVRELAVRLGAGYRFLHAPADAGGQHRPVTPCSPSRRSPTPSRRPAGPTSPWSASALPPTAPRPRSSTRSTSARASSRRSGTPARSATSRPATTTPTAQPIHGAVEDRILAVTLDDLIAIPHVIGVAHGRAKAPGVLGALRGHLIDSLVCDEALARHLLSEARSASASDNGGSCMPTDWLLILLAVVLGWSSSSSPPTTSRRRSTPRHSGCARSGTVSIGAGGKRYRGGRAFVAIAADDDGVVRDAIRLSGFTTFARAKAAPQLLGLRVNKIRGRARHRRTDQGAADRRASGGEAVAPSEEHGGTSNPGGARLTEFPCGPTRGGARPGAAGSIERARPPIPRKMPGKHHALACKGPTR